MGQNDTNTIKQSSKAGRIVKWVLLGFLLLILIALAVFGIWFYNAYGRELIELKNAAAVTAAASSREDFAGSQTSVVYYSDGSVMQILKGEKNMYYLPYEAIPADAVNAFLAVEDRKFFTHKGYDVYAIARAARAYIQNDGAIKQGGSTITQQLARLIFLNSEKTVRRKVSEIFLAAALERKYSKYDILEFYINNVYFANGLYGLQAAAKGYFNKTADALTLSQLAFLCGIPNSPSGYDPHAHFESALERRDSVLKQMYENGFISSQEYSDAQRETIVLTSRSTERNNYEETYTYDCAVKALMRAEGFAIRNSFESDEDKAMYEELYYDEYYRIKRTLYTKGYRIYTSINPVKQKQLQEAIDNGLAGFTDTNDEGIYKLQASGACIDNDTGFVVAAIGGRGQDYAGYTLNRAYQSPRQPGSSIKPLIVYTPAFENGYYPETIVVDERFPGGPRNSEHVYSGEIDVRYAVSVSKNTVAWKLFDELGINYGLGYLLKMNFAHIVDSDYVPAASLGGLTYGATAVEMTSAYAALANAGVFRSPTCVMRITDTEGNPIIDNTTTVTLAAHTVEEKRVYSKNSALMMTDVLTTVMKSGTGRKVAPEGLTSAGKTGTTNDQKDGWFVGYTTYYTTGIWVGYDMPVAMEDLMGNTYPGHIWQDYMQTIHEGLEDKPFEPYVDNRPMSERYPYGWIDNDGDGIPDGYPVDWVDTDGDGIPDDYPADWTDTDGVPDVFPYGWIDSDGDGIPDGYPEGWIDTDGDGTPDGYPEGLPDSDDDGIPDLYDHDAVIWVRPGEENGEAGDPAEGTWDGAAEGTWDGTSEGTWDGTSEGMWDGTSEGTWDGTSEGTWDGTSEGMWNRTGE